MVKKSIIGEIFSKARFADDPNTYKIFYRDFERIKDITLDEFIKESNNFQTIPIHRILFEKNSKKIE
jgi:hypothetical protein